MIIKIKKNNERKSIHEENLGFYEKRGWVKIDSELINDEADDVQIKKRSKKRTEE